MAKRLVRGRREELLDGFERLIIQQGFADLRMAEVASSLHCSAASLYKIAPSKESLVLHALSRWGQRTLDAAEAEAGKHSSACERARTYWLHVARALGHLSPQFRIDVERYDSTRLAWNTLSTGFIDRFSEMLDPAVVAGELRPVNTRFIARLLREMSRVTRDQEALQAVGMTAEEALLEIDEMLWSGIGRCRGAAGERRPFGTLG